MRPGPPQVPGEGPPGCYDEEGRWHHPPFEGILANRYTANTINDNFNMSDLLDFCRTYGVTPLPKKKRALIHHILRLVAEGRIGPPVAASAPVAPLVVVVGKDHSGRSAGAGTPGSGS